MTNIERQNQKLKELVKHLYKHLSKGTSHKESYHDWYNKKVSIESEISALEQIEPKGEVKSPEDILKEGGWWPYHDSSLNAAIPTGYVLKFMKMYHEQFEQEPKGEDVSEVYDEREALFQAFDKIRASFKGRHWLMEGRGCYPYDDERYKEEVRYIMDEFEEINTNLWKQIKSKSFEYKEKLRKDIIAELQAQSPLREELIKFAMDYNDFIEPHGRAILERIVDKYLNSKHTGK